MDPPVLILDDSTSSVDVGTEHEIQRAMQEVVKERTTLVIAHRTFDHQEGRQGAGDGPGGG